MAKVVTVNGKSRHIGGRRRPSENRRTHPHIFKSAKKFLKADLPQAPDSFDFSGAPGLRAILKNDVLGDCTSAGLWHHTESITAAAGNPVTATDDDAVNFYKLSTGYDGTPATDQGGDEVQVLTYARDHGLDGQGAHRILGFLSVDPTNWDELYTLAWLFEGTYNGAELLQGWESTADGGTWDVGTPADPNAGHCFVTVKGDRKKGLGQDTWGELIWLTPAAAAQTLAEEAGGNCFIIITAELIDRAKMKAPTGLDWEALVAAFDAQGGDLPAATSDDPGATPAPEASFWFKLKELFEEESARRAGIKKA